MKPLRLGTAAAIAVAGASLLAITPLALNYYLRAAYFNTLAAEAAKVRRPQYALIGDSITAGGGVWGWRLGRDPLSAVNFAANGSTVSQVAAQAPAALALHPRYLIVEGGVNDVFFSADTARWGLGLEGLVDRAKAAGTTVVLTLTPPVADAALNRRLDSVRKRLREAGVGAICVDLSPAMASRGYIERRFTSDGVHFTQAGYQEWAEAIRHGIANRTGCGDAPHNSSGL